MQEPPAPSTAVHVLVRVRAHPGSEAHSTTTVSDSDDNKREVCLSGGKSFNFDQAVGETGTQAHIFDVVGRPTLDSFLKGYNGTILCYGQTGSGKTYTMTGPSGRLGDSNLRRGILPRLVDEAFAELARRQKEDPKTFYRCACSYLEIHNEHITDLLASSASTLRVREAPTRGVFVEGLREVRLRSVGDALRALASGTRRRTTSSTIMNEASSRSHAVFTLRLERVTQAPDDGRQRVRTSQLNLVDLAGSERQMSTAKALERSHDLGTSASALGTWWARSSLSGGGGTAPATPRGAPYGDEGSDAGFASGDESGCDGGGVEAPPVSRQQLQEACYINKSLSALSGVIHALNAGRPHVPYRDSKLTTLLRDSLGGSACTWLVATVSPLPSCRAETLSTLLFAQRAQQVRNRATLQPERLLADGEDLLKDAICDEEPPPTPDAAVAGGGVTGTGSGTGGEDEARADQERTLVERSLLESGLEEAEDELSASHAACLELVGEIRSAAELAEAWRARAAAAEAKAAAAEVDAAAADRRVAVADEEQRRRLVETNAATEAAVASAVDAAVTRAHAEATTQLEMALAEARAAAEAEMTAALANASAAATAELSSALAAEHARAFEEASEAMQAAEAKAGEQRKAKAQAALEAAVAAARAKADGEAAAVARAASAELLRRVGVEVEAARAEERAAAAAAINAARAEERAAARVSTDHQMAGMQAHNVEVQSAHEAAMAALASRHAEELAAASTAMSDAHDLAVRRATDALVQSDAKAAEERAVASCFIRCLSVEVRSVERGMRAARVELAAQRADQQRALQLAEEETAERVWREAERTRREQQARMDAEAKLADLEEELYLHLGAEVEMEGAQQAVKARTAESDALAKQLSVVRDLASREVWLMEEEVCRLRRAASAAAAEREREFRGLAEQHERAMEVAHDEAESLRQCVLQRDDLNTALAADADVAARAHRLELSALQARLIEAQHDLKAEVGKSIDATTPGTPTRARALATLPSNLPAPMKSNGAGCPSTPNPVGPGPVAALVAKATAGTPKAHTTGPGPVSALVAKALSKQKPVPPPAAVAFLPIK